MAIRTWNSAGDTNMNDGTNYTGVGPISSLDDLIFNNTSVIPASATAPLNINSIMVSSNFTGNWTSKPYTITSNTSLNFGLSGTLSVGDIIITNSGNLTIYSGMASLDNNDSRLYIMSDSTLAVNKFDTGWSYSFKEIHMAYPGTRVLMNNANGRSMGGDYVRFHGGYFEHIGQSSDLYITPTTNSYPLVIDPSSTIKFTHYSTGMMIRPRNTQPITIYVPAMTIGGDGEICYQRSTGSSGSVTYELMGDISIGNFNPGSYLQTSDSFTFNSNGHSINVASAGFGYVSLICNSSGTSSTIWNLANSNIYCEGFRFTGGKSSTSADLTNTNVICSGFFTIDNIPGYVNPSGSVFRLIKTSTIGTKLVPFDKFILDVPKGTLTWSDGCIFNRLLVTPGTTCKCKAGSGYLINEYVNGDWDGAIFISTTNNTHYHVANPVGMKVWQANFRDMFAANDILVYSGKTSGGNTGIIFPTASIIRKKTAQFFNRLLRRR